MHPLPSKPLRLTRLPLLSAAIVVGIGVISVQAQQTPAPPAASLPPSQTLPGNPSTASESMPAVTASITAPSPLTRDEQILHLLNRLTYGPRPGDLERVRVIGINKWLSDQFNPQSIDDSALDRRLADYPAMQLPIERLMEQYPNAQMIRATLANHNSVPHGEGEKAIYKAETERVEDRKKKAQANPTADPEALPDTPEAILAQNPAARFKTLCHLTPPQLRTLRQQLAPNRGEPDRRDQLTAGFTPRQIEELAAIASPQGVVASELVQTKLLRDIYSERQLQEVMTDFWLNHFNVFIRKSQEAPYLITSYERDTIRPHALGHFERLLVSTAISPAMLNYLDNAQSIGPNSRLLSAEYTLARGARRPAANATGLNENYAREIMELHTLGVNGGYTQHDVTEVAKVFTGWTLDRNYGQERGLPAVHAFFDPLKHEPGNKTVLGVTIKDGGSTEGMKVLHLLASSPQTARFISTKLAIRFVSDDPPPALIDAMVAAWQRTNGDIRLVLIAMLQSPDFFTRETYRAKVKTPQDYVISAVRASGADVQSAGAIARVTEDLGMPVYGMQTPNGYSMRSDAWNNTAALVSRMNFALALSADRLTGVRTDWPDVTGIPFSTPTGQLSGTSSQSPQQTATLLEDKLLHQRVSDRTRATILTQLSTTPDQQLASLRQVATKTANGRDPLTAVMAPTTRPPDIPDPQTALTAGLLFGSPEFQRR